MNDHDRDKLREKLRETNTNFFFLRNKTGHRIGVVALRYSTRREGGSGVTIAVSLCHGNDVWTSDKGIAAALGRLDARNLKYQESVTYRVDERITLLDDVFSVLTPSGIWKRSSEIDWDSMQTIFERQWKYLTTPKPEKRSEPEAEAPASA